MQQISSLINEYKESAVSIGEELMTQDAFRYLQGRVRSSKILTFLLGTVGVAMILASLYMGYSIYLQSIGRSVFWVVEDDALEFGFSAVVMALLGAGFIAGGLWQKRVLLQDIQQPMKEKLRVRLLHKRIEKDGDHELLFAVPNIGDIDVSPRIYEIVEEGSWWILERAKQSDRNFRMYREADHFILFDWIQNISPKR